MFAHGGCLNRGCEAIVRSSSKMIKENINNSYISVASLRMSSDNILENVDNVFDGNSKDIKLSLLKKIRTYAELKLFNSEDYILSNRYKNTIEKIKDSDICLSIGGDNYCYGEQEWLYVIDKNIKRKGKKLVLWACSIGEEDMSTKKLKDLKTFDLIIARESLTYEMLKSKGINNVKLCADPAFTMEAEYLSLPKGWKAENTIGLNFSPLVLKRNKESKEAVRELIKYILNSTDLVIALTPHVMEEGNNDYELLKEFYDEFKNTKRVILLPNTLTATQYKGYISRMRFFIGARTHATIAAYSTEVPTMVLGYSVKSRGIAKDLFGEEKLVLGIDEISDSNRLKEGFDELIRDEQLIKDKLKSVLPNIKQLSYKSTKYLEELIG